MFAFAYDRVSSARQAARTELEERYFHVIKAHCERRGWKLKGSFSDAISGRNAERPGLEAAISAAIATRGVVVFYDLSRFSRSFQDLLDIANRLKSQGASLASSTEAIDTSDENPAAQLVFHIVGACAEFTSKLTSMKVRHSNFRRIQECGYRTQGTSPAGFRVIDGKRVEIPAEQEVLAQVRSLIGEGFDYATVARQLDTLGTPTIRQLRGYKRAGAWTAAGVRRLARTSPIQAGVVP